MVVKKELKFLFLFLIILVGVLGVVSADGPQPCDTHANCDDQLFCNGVEQCVNNVCVAGTSIVCDTPPSEPSEQCYDSQGTCNENTNTCDYTFTDNNGPVTSDLTVTKVIDGCL